MRGPLSLREHWVSEGADVGWSLARKAGLGRDVRRGGGGGVVGAPSPISPTVAPVFAQLTLQTRHRKETRDKALGR